MATNTTVERILDGALSALARHGHRKLSMSDVCEEARISRGTLYRYFRNKSEILEAIGQHVAAGVREELAAATAEKPNPAERFHVVFDVLTDYRRHHPEAAQAFEAEPEFTLRFVREVFPHFVDIVAEVLSPAAEHIPVLRDNVITVRQLADLVLRVNASTFFVPTPEVDEIPGWIRKLGCFTSASTAGAHAS